MHPYRLAPMARPTHVLVVEHEPAELRKTCDRLLVEGCELSTARVAFGLVERIAQLEPDMILVDVLMPNFECADLSRLVARARADEPSVVIHTSVLRPLLRRVVDMTKVLAVITRTANDAEFSRMFREAERIVRARAAGPALAAASGISGTRAASPKQAPLEAELQARKQA
jgi:CheY-like chemotaxis protein